MLKKIAAIAIGASVGLAIVALCGAAQAKDSRPPVKNVAKYSNALLTLTQNSRQGIAKGELVFTNISKGPITILGVDSNCDCIKPKYNHKPVAPGKQGTVSIAYTSSSDDPNTHYITVVFSNNEGGITFFVNKKVTYTTVYSR